MALVLVFGEACPHSKALPGMVNRYRGVSRVGASRVRHSYNESALGGRNERTVRLEVSTKVPERRAFSTALSADSHSRRVERLLELLVHRLRHGLGSIEDGVGMGMVPSARPAAKGGRPGPRSRGNKSRTHHSERLVHDEHRVREGRRRFTAAMTSPPPWLTP